MPHRTRTFLPLYIAVFIVVLIALGVVGFNKSRPSGTNTANTNAGQTLDVSDIEVVNLNESLDELETLESDLVAPDLDATVDLN